MRLTKEKKGDLISEYKADLSCPMIAFVGYTGMKNETIDELRDEMDKNGIGFKVTKNTLLRIALKEAGYEIPQEILDKQLAIAISSDEITPAKSLYDFSKKKEVPQIYGGIMNGQFISESDIKKLALLPSREELLGKVVGTIAGPSYSFVNVLAANLRGLVSVLSQYQSKIS